MTPHDAFGLLQVKAVRQASALLVNDPESCLAKLNGKAKELRLAVKELEKTGFLAVYRRRGGRIESVVFLIEEYPATTQAEQLPQTVQAIQPPQKQENSGTSAPIVEVRKKFLPKPKGKVRETRRAAEKGDRSEDFLFHTAGEVLEAFRRIFPDIFLEGECTKSGRHRPINGQVDERDHAGDDVCVTLTVRQHTGQWDAGCIILDSKSSRPSVERFNSAIRIFPGQEKARTKKAVCANPSCRTKTDLASELIELLVQVGLCPLEQPQRETVLDWLEQR